MTLATETILATGMSLALPLRLPHRSMPASPMAVAVGIPVAGLPHRKFRFFPFRSLAFRTWQRRPDQPAMNRTVVLDGPFVLDGVLIRRFGVSRDCDGEIGSGRSGGFMSGGIEFVRAVVGRRVVNG